MNADGQKAGFNLPRGGAREVRLAATRRTIHEDPAADALAIRFEHFGVREGVDDFQPDLLFHRVHAADIAKLDFGPLYLGRRLRLISLPGSANSTARNLARPVVIITI